MMSVAMNETRSANTEVPGMVGIKQSNSDLKLTADLLIGSA
jgi:hypothetical protein